MSYILDALRRADAERSRGTVPGIHAQPSYAAPTPVAPPRRSRSSVWAGVAAVLAVLLAAELWYSLRSAAPAPAVVAVTPGAAVAPAASGVPAAMATSADRPTAAARPAARSPAPAGDKTGPRADSAVAHRAPTSAAAPHPANGARAAAASPPHEPKPAPESAGEPHGPGAAPAARPAATGTPRVYALNELPDDIRRALPALNVGGAMYSSTPADRVLILNGLVLHEGDPISAELQLVQIQRKSAVLSFRGYRYTVGY